METSNEVVVPEHYNPNQLVTYKVIADNTVTYPTTKVTDIEWALESYRKTKENSYAQSRKIAQLEESLSDYLDMDSEDIVVNICEIFGFNPTKEIEFEATVKVTGTVSVPLSQVSEFDINDIDLRVDVECYNYDISCDAEVEDISTI